MPAPRLRPRASAAPLTDDVQIVPLQTGVRSPSHAALEALPTEATSLIMSHLAIHTVNNLSRACKLLLMWVRAFDEVHLDYYDHPLPHRRLHVDFKKLASSKRSLRSFTLAFTRSRCPDQEHICNVNFMPSHVRLLFKPSLFDNLQQLALENLGNYNFPSHARGGELLQAILLSIEQGRLPHLLDLTLAAQFHTQKLSKMLLAISAHCPKLRYLDLREARTLYTPFGQVAPSSPPSDGNLLDGLAGSLKLLDLSFRETMEFFYTQGAFTDLTYLVSKCSTLITLDVSYAVRASAAFCDAIGKASTLRELYLRGIGLHTAVENERKAGGDLNRFWDALAAMPFLEYLDVRNNRLCKRAHTARRMLEALAPRWKLHLNTEYADWETGSKRFARKEVVELCQLVASRGSLPPEPTNVLPAEARNEEEDAFAEECRRIWLATLSHGFAWLWNTSAWAEPQGQAASGS